MAKSFYPNLSSIVTVDQLPEQLQFIEDGLQQALDKIYYKDLQFVKSPDGSNAFFDLTLVTNEAIKINLSEGGMAIIVNPSGAGETLVPLRLSYNWPIISLISGFDLNDFADVPDQFKDLFEKVVDLGDIEMIQVAIGTFEGDQSHDAYIAFVDKINEAYSIPLINELTHPVDERELSMAQHVKSEIDTSIVLTDSIREIINVVYVNSNNLSTYKDNLSRISTAILGEPIESFVKNLITPRLEASLDLSLGLSFPRNILTPLQSVGGDPISEPELSILIFSAGTLNFSTQGGIGFDKDMSVSLNHPSMIGNTGLGINITNVKLDLSRTNNIVEADLDGRPSDFMGVYVEEIGVTLPEKWFKNQTPGTTAEIYGKNLLIGTGGISGIIGLQAVGSYDILWADIGDNGFRVGFKNFDIEFKQNKVIESNILGAMEIPKFVYPAGTLDGNGLDIGGQIVTIGIAGHIHDDGDFNLTASATPPYPIEFPNVFTYHIGSLELGKEEDDFYIGTSGKLEFMGFLKDTLKLQEIEIDRLRIYSDGSIEFEGGSIALVEPIVLNLGPVEITVSAIHYGSHQKEVNGVMRKFNYFGFDGGISVDPLGVEIRGDGVKFYYCTDDLPDTPPAYLHIQTLYLDLTLPAKSPAAIINGWLSIPEPGTSPEYAGGIKLQLPQAKISGSADMKLQPRYPAFIIDASIDLPAPITIGPVGIYGFRGLLGYRYVAEKEAAGLTSGVDSWYDYYKAPPRGIHVQKFNGPDKTKSAGTPFSIGAGASLGTSFDNGTVLNIKAMLLLSIPSLFMIDGRAAILSARLGLDDAGEPPFFAFIAIGDNSLELGFGADFKMPSSNGNILKLYADIQAGFFFNDSSKWYVNIGTKNNPVTARVLTLVTITSYIMLSAKGIEAGARGEFDFKREYGPIKVHAWAYIEVGGKISFEKPQFGAYLAAGVGADIDIKIVSLYASFDVLFGVESPKPFLIYGEFRLCVKIKIMWVFSFKFCGNLSVSWEFNSSIDRTPINPLINPSNNGAIPKIAQGVNMLSNETFELAYLGSAIPTGLTPAILDKIIPIDTYIDIKTEKGLLPNAISSIIGGVNNPAERHVEMVPPQKIIKGKEVRQVKHQYSIESLNIKSWNPQTSNWDEYNPYKALYPSDPTLDTLKVGQFQKDGKQYNTVRLLATTPFSYTEQGQPGWYIPEQNGITAASLFCEGEKEVEECANFLGKPLGTKYYCYNENQLFYSNQVAFLLLNRDGFDHAQVLNTTNPFGLDQSLRFENKNGLQIRLPRPSVDVNLKLTSFASSVEVRYYASIMDDDTMQVHYGNPDASATDPNAPYTVVVPSSSLNAPVNYNQPTWLPVTRIEIRPVLGNQQQIDDLVEQIAQIEENNNQIALGNTQGKEPQSTEGLQRKLDELLAIGCTLGKPCNRDEKLCALYDSILQILKECIVDPKAYNQRDLKKYIDCVRSIYQQLLGVMGQNPPSQLEGIASVLENFLNEPNIQTYQMAWDALQDLINYLIKIGNCDCNENSNKCYTALHEICWLTLEQYQYNINIPGQAAIEEDTEATIAGITQYIQPVWRPNTHFIVNFKLKDVVDNGASSPGNYSFTYGFTTAGPVGFFHKDEKATYGDILLENGNTLEDANGIIRTSGGVIVPPDPMAPITPHPDNYALTNLKRYVDYNRSYPNADGNLLSSKPLFYNDETTRISLFFSKAYATHFFTTWPAYNGNNPVDGRLKIVIKDPREDSLIENPPYLDYDPADTQYTNIPQTIESWDDDPNPIVPSIFQMYQNLIESNECIPFGGNAIVPPSQFMNVIPKHLKPLKLYTALVNNLFDRDGNGVLKTEEVHRFGFQTSRYATFKQQVESYIMSRKNKLSLDKKSEDLISAYTTVNIQAGLDTLTGTPNPIGDALIGTFPNAYDRVVEGIFGLTPFPTPTEKPEFKLIRNSSNGDEVIAVVILNPVPLNSTKVPELEVLDQIQVLDALGVLNTDYKVALSPDYSQAIVMHTSLGFVGDLLYFQFEHPITAEAIFAITKDIDPLELDAAYDTIVGTPNTLSDALDKNYQHKFDRIIEGVLAFPPMEKAITTEFNVLRNSNDSDKIVGLLIRNPEPFNVPKLPIGDVGDTIQIVDGTGTEITSFKKIFSKDYSQVLFIPDSKEITSPLLNVKFSYKLWNGSAYIVPGIPNYTSDEVGTILVPNIDVQNA